MTNLIKCPKCNGKEQGCTYCINVGYIFDDTGRHYSVDLDQQQNPIKGKLLNPGASNLSDLIFPQEEPHDLLWFVKNKKNRS